VIEHRQSALQRAVEWTVSRLKRDPDYRIASDYTNRQLATILWHRVRQYARGIPLRALTSSVHGTVFRGRRVVVEHAYQLSSRGPLVLEDGVWLNALSDRGIELGCNVTIARGAVLTCTGVIARCGVGIRIGDRSAVGAFSFLGGQGGIDVGSDVIMGPSVRIFSENHDYADVDRPIRAQGETRAAVTIEDDCWIGAGATILAGVTIQRGCVIAAGAVVTRDVPAFSVVAGVPARVIKSRQARESISELAGAARMASPSLAGWFPDRAPEPLGHAEAGNALRANQRAATESPTRSPTLREME
jgi:acetyltransferase-like isoleucine patch superfamily enzyme